MIAIYTEKHPREQQSLSRDTFFKDTTYIVFAMSFIDLVHFNVFIRGKITFTHEFINTMFRILKM